jgi:hypothetical protein
MVDFCGNDEKRFHLIIHGNLNNYQQLIDDSVLLSKSANEAHRNTAFTFPYHCSDMNIHLLRHESKCNALGLVTELFTCHISVAMLADCAVRIDITIRILI